MSGDFSEIGHLLRFGFGLRFGERESGTKPEGNDRRRAANGSTPLMRRMKNADHDERARGALVGADTIGLVNRTISRIRRTIVHR
jgi:hypothetical protein